MATLLTDKGEFSVPATNGLFVSAADAARATGWTLKPEGMCRDEICVPLAAGAVRGDRVDLGTSSARRRCTTATCGRSAPTRRTEARRSPG